MAVALIDQGRIKTTSAKAKSLSRAVDRLITMAKRNTMHARRELAAEVGEKAAKKLMTEIREANAERAGGYTRIIRLGQRMGDGAQMAMIELTGITPAAK